MQRPDASRSKTFVERDDFEELGPIEALDKLDWKTEVPERIYKFADKYNLTMGSFSQHPRFPI